jgi:hypothetical protein
MWEEVNIKPVRPGFFYGSNRRVQRGHERTQRHMPWVIFLNEHPLRTYVQETALQREKHI